MNCYGVAQSRTRLKRLSSSSSSRRKWGFPCGSDDKRICLQCGRPRSNLWARKIPWRRQWLPTPVFLPGKSHGQRSLLGYILGSAKSGTRLMTNSFIFPTGEPSGCVPTPPQPHPQDEVKTRGFLYEVHFTSKTK